MFSYKIVSRVFENVLVDEIEIFVNFSIKRGIRKLPQSLSLVEVGPPNSDCASLVGRFNNYVCDFFDFLVPTTLPKKSGKFGVTIEFKFVNIVRTFFYEKNLNTNLPSGGVHLDFRI